MSLFSISKQTIFVFLKKNSRQFASYFWRDLKYFSFLLPAVGNILF